MRFHASGKDILPHTIFLTYFRHIFVLILTKFTVWMWRCATLWLNDQDLLLRFVSTKGPYHKIFNWFLTSRPKELSQSKLMTFLTIKIIQMFPNLYLKEMEKTQINLNKIGWKSTKMWWKNMSLSNFGFTTTKVHNLRLFFWTAQLTNPNVFFRRLKQIKDTDQFNKHIQGSSFVWGCMYCTFWKRHGIACYFAP